MADGDDGDVDITVPVEVGEAVVPGSLDVQAYFRLEACIPAVEEDGEGARAPARGDDVEIAIAVEVGGDAAHPRVGVDTDSEALRTIKSPIALVDEESEPVRLPEEHQHIGVAVP